jgi:hypothetical protein
MYPIDKSVDSQQEFPRSIQLAALEEYLSDAEIQTICAQYKSAWRDRLFPPGLTVRSLVWRGLSHDRSIGNVLADLAANDARFAEEGTESGWCQARARLPKELWPELIWHNARRVEKLARQQHLYRGRPVYMADGSTLSMPDEPGLVKAFGYTNTRHGRSRFPVARITFLAQAGLQVIWDYRLDPYKTSEDSQFHQMWQRIPENAICLGDRHFGSFYNMAKLRQRGVDLISRLNQRRSASKLIRHGKKIGKNQWLVTFYLAPQLRKKYNDPLLPESLQVRLIRVWFYHGQKRHTLWIVTTLLDPRAYPPDEIVQWYRRRWMIETRIGSIKTTLQLNVLRGKTENSVRSEVAATILAHNLVWLLIHQAAARCDVPAERISFACAVKLIIACSRWFGIVSATKRQVLYDRMLKSIARHTNRHRPGRVEPRLIKRELVRFGYLRTSRQEARAKCLS